MGKELTLNRVTNHDDHIVHHLNNKNSCVYVILVICKTEFIVFKHSKYPVVLKVFSFSYACSDFSSVSQVLFYSVSIDSTEKSIKKEAQSHFLLPVSNSYLDNDSTLFFYVYVSLLYMPLICNTILSWRRARQPIIFLCMENSMDRGYGQATVIE